MPRKPEKRYGRKEKLSLDAAIVWALHLQNAPMPFETLLKHVAKIAGATDQLEQKAFRKKVKYDYIRFLSEKKILRKLRKSGRIDEVYALKDYAARDAKILWGMEEYMRINGEWPTVERIAAEIGITPEVARNKVYKLAPIISWSDPNHKSGEANYRDFVGLLELAAWIQLGCSEQTNFVRKRWSPNDLRSAQRLLSEFPEFTPSIDTFRYDGENEGQFHYKITWPDSPLQMNIDSLYVHDANQSDFRGCGLTIQRRPVEGKRIPNSISEKIP